MESGITIFNHPKFGDIRATKDEKGEALFNVVDICKALEYSNNRVAVATHCESGDVTKLYVIDSLGRKQEASFVNESGLYALIFGSKVPKAKEFKHWVTSEVLPSIRKTGGYIQANTDMTDEEIMARALMVAQSTIKRRDERIKELSDKVAHDAPKVAFCDAVTSSRGSILIGELAKQITQNGVEIGQNRLFRWMRHNGFLGQSGMNFNIPLQRYVQQGLFELKTTVHTEGTDLVRAVTPMVTTKGQAYFMNGFLSGRFSPAPAGGR